MMEQMVITTLGNPHKHIVITVKYCLLFRPSDLFVNIILFGLHIKSI